MGNIRRLAGLLVLLLALTWLLPMQVSAAENGTIWFESKVTAEGVTVSLWTDTDVASGVITINYDKKALTFRQLELEEAYIAAHAINSKRPGVVQISWVAPADAASADAHLLMQLHFEGASAENISISGSGYTTTGESVYVAALDFVALNALIEEAEGKLQEDYTQESFAAMRNALDEAKALLEQQHVTPAQISAAAEKLQAAMDALQQPQPETQPGVTPGGDEDQNHLVAEVAIVSTVVIAAVALLLVILKKRGNKACA